VKENKRLKIKIATNSGFCFGVKRAIDLVEKATRQNQRVYTLGPIIHNPQEVNRLEKQGIKILKDSKRIKEGFVALRTHGIPFDIHKKLAANKAITIIDATCPFVKKAQNIVKRLSANMKSRDEKIIIIGQKVHPEVVALSSYGNGKCVVIKNPKEAGSFKVSARIQSLNIVSQTTQVPKNFDSAVRVLKKKYPVKVHNTICKATLDRQKSAEKLAKNVDLMIVIGGKNSSNTTRLAQICQTKVKTYHIETFDDLKEKWFKKIESVGLTAGASTPAWVIKDVQKQIKEIDLKRQAN
jgi:4-hydroxy-3-methylbut-2-enyl diphosphate reductase